MFDASLATRAAAFGVLVWIVLLLVNLGLDQVGFDEALAPWQRSLLVSFVGGAGAFAAYRLLGVEKRLPFQKVE